MKEIRTRQFAGKEYKFVVLDVEGVKEVPGVDNLVGVADHLQGSADATWWTFEDEQTVRDKHWHFKPDEIILDCGAAFGSYAIMAAIQGAKVIAFEPNRFCRSMLEQNIALNPGLDIQIRPIGVYSSQGFFDPNTAKFSSVSTGPACLEVEKIDDLITGNVDCIKMDIEGGEYEALLGAEQTIRACKPRLLIEEHDVLVPGVGAKCEQFLAGLGYKRIERYPYGSGSHGYYEIPPP